MTQLRRSARVQASTTAQTAPPAKKQKTEKKPVEAKPKTAEPQLDIGDAIPDITLANENGEDINLAEEAKKSKFIVIFAYPRASTPGCTRQACGFQRNFEAFKKLGATVFGLLADQPKAQLNFVSKQGLEYLLLLDPSRELIGRLGARKSPSGVIRSHWVFVDGKLAVKRIQVSPEVSISSALEEVKKLADGKEDATEAKEESKEESKEDPKEEPKEESKEEPKEELKEELKEDEPKEEPKEDGSDAKTDEKDQVNEKVEVSTADENGLPKAEPATAEVWKNCSKASEQKSHL